MRVFITGHDGYIGSVLAPMVPAARAIFPYWREIWLSRVDENGQQLAKQSTTLAST